MLCRFVNLPIFTLLLASSISTFAAEGFKPLSSPEIPEAVRNSANGVFRFVGLRPRSIPNENLKDAQNDYCQSTETIFQLLCAEVNECLKSAPTADCIVSPKFDGSAFLTSNRRTIMSVRHNFDPLFSDLIKNMDPNMANKEKLALFMSSNPPFLLLNSNNQIVYDSRKSAVKFKKIGMPDLMYDLDERVFHKNKDTDFVELELGTDLDATPIDLENNAVKIDDPLYIVGFPAKTLSRATNNSDGASQLVSMGNAISPKDFFLLTNPDKILSERLSELFSDQHVFINADGMHGQSGAPVLNRAGKVVSIFHTHLGPKPLDSDSDPFDGYIENAAWSIRPSWISSLWTSVTEKLGAN